MCGCHTLQVFNGTAQDVEFTIEMDQTADWINDVKKIIKKDLFESGKSRYGLACRLGQP